jgi:fatty-acyl-CoA synthase
MSKIEYLSVVDYIRQQDKKRNGEGIAIEYDGNKITRNEYWKRIEHYKHFFLSNGFSYGCGKPVAICNLNAPEYEFIYMALLEIGAIASTVSLLFFKNDIKRHSTGKGADTIVLSVEYCSPELKEAFKQLGDNNGEQSVKKIIFTSAGDYKSEENATAYNGVLDCKAMINSLELPANIEVILPSELSKYDAGSLGFQAEGQKINLLDADATYSNTGGTTTGTPNCAVHTHRAIISLLVSHEKENYPEYTVQEGDKSLLLIPISHITAQFYGLLLRRASGATIIYNQAFDPKTFVEVMITQRINDVVAPFGLYLSLALAATEKGLYSNLKTPVCGGEPAPYNVTKFVNEKLKFAGGQPLIVGCGSTEFGSGIMASYGIDDRVNESGKLFYGSEAIILNPYTGKFVENGEKGVLFVSVPWQMKCYLNNEEATKNFFSYKDKAGKVYGSNGDIVSMVREHDGKPVYTMYGRCSDFIYQQQKNIYIIGYSDHNTKPDKDFSEGLFLFEIKEDLLNINGILEAQVLILPEKDNADNTGRIVANIVLMPNAEPASIIKEIYNSNMTTVPAGIKILTNFARSLVTDKREIRTLKDVRNDYYCVKGSKIQKISFGFNAKPTYADVTDLSEIKAVPPPELGKVSQK